MALPKKTFPVGSRPRVRFRLLDEDGTTLLDDPSIVVTVRPPTGAPIVFNAPEHEGTGVYSVHVDADLVGWYHARAETDGATKAASPDVSFLVEPTETEV